MFKEQHNKSSKEFLKKILMFIDANINRIALSSPEDSNKILVSALINVKDSILSELVRDSHIVEINKSLSEKQNDKKKLKKDQNDLNQENELVNTQEE